MQWRSEWCGRAAAAVGDAARREAEPAALLAAVSRCRNVAAVVVQSRDGQLLSLSGTPATASARARREVRRVAS